jgi:hypothetical protein
MIAFATFALYICFSALLLVIVPVMMHPTLPLSRKLLIFAVTFLVFVPAGIALYAWLGAPQMAGLS